MTTVAVARGVDVDVADFMGEATITGGSVVAGGTGVSAASAKFGVPAAVDSAAAAINGEALAAGIIGEATGEAGDKPALGDAVVVTDVPLETASAGLMTGDGCGAGVAPRSLEGVAGDAVGVAREACASGEAGFVAVAVAGDDASAVESVAWGEAAANAPREA